MQVQGLRRFATVIITLLFLTAGPVAGSALSAESGGPKIATVNIQEVLSASSAGQEAKKQLESKVVEIQAALQKEQENLDAQRSEIEKKSSVWSETVRQEKEREYQKKMREMQLKSEDAQYELQQLEKKIMSPIIKDLQQVIAEIGRKNGFTMILDSRAGLLYADPTLDISELVREELDARLAEEEAEN